MVELMAGRFRSLGEPVRLRILQVLEAGETTVSGIVDQLAANQSNVSRHLQNLFDAGIVGRRREGNTVFYFIADPTILKICELVCDRAQEEARIQLAELSKRPRR
jgi:DNA-binding transcriptional ArsR family regulator